VRRSGSSVMSFLSKTPVRTFVLYPLLAIVWELVLGQGRLKVQVAFVILMIWGYLQFRFCGHYRTRHGGGGPGLGQRPQRLVTTGPYAYARNPMYLGHIIFLAGLSLTLSSLFAGFLTVAVAVWFHWRVLEDEHNLAGLWGEPYRDYRARVKRWIPGTF
jgi:protein-S-isoprenylcysteine O-methyltransferase Ste14